MTEATAHLRHLRIAPRKIRLLAGLVRGMGLKEAKLQLQAEVKRGALPILKLLKSAETNAKHNFKMEPENLFIKIITVDGGPVLKRRMPRARGRATVIRKRTSHVSVVLAEAQKKESRKKQDEKKKIKN